MKAYLVYNKTTGEYRGFQHGFKWLSWGPRAKAKVYDKLPSAKNAVYNCYDSHENGDVVEILEVEQTELVIARFVMSVVEDEDSYDKTITFERESA